MSKENNKIFYNYEPIGNVNISENKSSKINEINNYFEKYFNKPINIVFSKSLK